MAPRAHYSADDALHVGAEIGRSGRFETALKTGMRQGEVARPHLGRLDLSDAVIRVRRSITDGHLGVPKNHERRDADLTQDVVELLGGWWGTAGSPTTTSSCSQARAHWLPRLINHPQTRAPPRPQPRRDPTGRTDR